MFLSTCAGCVQVPTPVYYWNPYMVPYAKKPAFQISDILQVTHGGNHVTKSDLQHNSSANQSTSANIDKVSMIDARKAHDQGGGWLVKKSLPPSVGLRDRRNDTQAKALNYSIKSHRCTVQSALEPLQALCTAGPRGYRDTSPVDSASKQRELKFGINKILSEEFGKEKQNKENKVLQQARQDGGRGYSSCECTYDACRVYADHARYPSHVLSAVHAIQPPKYPTSPPGTDILPGPYSVLNTDVNVGQQTKRKRSWSRAVFSNLQRKGLEKRFEVQKYVTKPDRRQLAAMLGLTDAQVKVWFQNRRMKWRHAQQQQALDTSDDTSQHADDVTHNAKDNAKLPEALRVSTEPADSDMECMNSDNATSKEIMMESGGDSSDDDDVTVHDARDGVSGGHQQE